MVQRITSNATVESSDKNEGAGPGDDDAGVSGSLTSQVHQTVKMMVVP